MTDASHAQRQASSPEHSCWVEASAGTGKTKVLTDRVLNLLLTGAASEHILCLTFTKAASSEMANRIQEKLSTWAALSEPELRRSLEELLGRAPSQAEYTRGKKLFSMVIDTPGGMKIQTIHSFCQMVLKKFPLEAEIPPHFTVMSESKSQELLTLSFQKALSAISKENLACLAKHGSSAQLFDLLGKLTSKRRKFTAMLKQNVSRETFLRKIYAALELPFQISPSQILEENLDRTAPIHPNILEEGSSKDQAMGNFFKTWDSKTIQEKTKNFEAYKTLFLTATGTIRQSLVSAALAKKIPEVQPALQKEAERLQTIMTRYHHAIVAEASAALVTFTAHVLEEYQSLKSMEALLDYDDLIHLTADLFQKPDIAPWVLYKLDGGIQHILVDEAQDTNEDQWQVIAAIASEFFSEEPDPDNPRTLFVVGDMKQSIYSFQGASPVAFQAVKGFFSNTSTAANHAWREINLATSFRSTEPILQLVDDIFQDNPKLSPSGLSLSYVPHTAHRKDHGGHVELWPLVEAEEKEERTPWEIPHTQKQYTSPRKALAQRIAKTIQTWIQKKQILSAKNRPIRPSDIMILVRRRDHFVEALVRALKNVNVPVTGVDRLVLTEHIAIQDLMVLGDFLLLPEDDLALATLLKSPLIGLTEEELLELAHPRKSRSLWHALKQEAYKNPAYKKAFDYLTNLMQQVDFSTPFELYHHILNTLGGRKAMVGRLGTEAEDAMEEFLNLCLDFDHENVGSLQAFLSWMRRENTEIKRNLEQSGEDKVRIMTVHGSKGLQAPIVFLPDTTQVPLSRSTLFWQDDDPEDLLLFWCPKAKFKTPVIQDLHPQFDEMAEYYRLLYVALTRAEDQLYIGGWKPKTRLDEKSWYTTIQESLEKLGQKTEDVVHLHKEGIVSHAPPTENIVPQKDTLAPKWLHTPVPTENPPSVVNPSTADTPADFQGHGATYSISAATRGTLIHTALEWMMKNPNNPPWEIIEAYLQKSLSPDESAHALETLKKTLSMPVLQKYFDQGILLTETDICDFDKKNQLSTKGSIDFLFIDESAKVIDIIDYKTGAFDSTYEHTPPAAYGEQMKLYKKILETIYPNYTVRTFLLWTEVQKLIESHP